MRRFAQAKSLILASLKTKLLAAGGILIAGLIAALKFMSAKASRQEKRADIAEANVERVVRTQERETEIDNEYSYRAGVANEEIKAGEIPSHLAKRRVR